MPSCPPRPRAGASRLVPDQVRDGEEGGVILPDPALAGCKEAGCGEDIRGRPERLRKS